jgi:hypothetical protein
VGALRSGAELSVSPGPRHCFAAVGGPAGGRSGCTTVPPPSRPRLVAAPRTVYSASGQAQRAAGNAEARVHSVRLPDRPARDGADSHSDRRCVPFGSATGAEGTRRPGGGRIIPPMAREDAAEDRNLWPPRQGPDGARRHLPQRRRAAVAPLDERAGHKAQRGQRTLSGRRSHAPGETGKPRRKRGHGNPEDALPVSPSPSPTAPIRCLRCLRAPPG